MNQIKDFDGSIVPVGTAPDIGAYEFSGTPDPQITVPVTKVPTATTVPTGGTTHVSITVLLHGIGKGGDNVNLNSAGNMNPLHPQRQLTVELYDATNILKIAKQGAVAFNQTGGSFSGVFDVGAIPGGAYTVKLRVPHYLTRAVPGIITIDPNTTGTEVIASLITGDSNGDNALSILDYNMLLDCFSDLSTARNCADPSKKEATDFTDDGSVNQFDYNLFLRELSVQTGQ